MTSERTTTPRGTGGHRADGSGYGLIVFAGILLFVLGFFNMLYGAAAIANSRVFVTNAHNVTGNLRFWGWITLIIAVLQLAAAAGILSDLQLARWSGVALLALNAIDMMFFRPAYPFWALTIIAIDVGRAVRALRLRQPRQPGRLARKCPPQLRTSFMAWGLSCPRRRPGSPNSSPHFRDRAG